MTSLFARVSEMLGEPVAPRAVQAPPRPATRPAPPAPPPPPTPTPEPQAAPVDGDEPEMSLAESLAFCLTRETDPETQLTCAAYMIAEPEDASCPDHLIMLTQPGCVYCDRARHRYEDLFKSKLIEEVDLHSERGKSLAMQAGIDFTPGLVVVGCDDRLRASLDNALHPRVSWHENMGTPPPSISELHVHPPDEDETDEADDEDG